MASPFQQASVQRKLVYFVLIVALFSVTLFLRQGMTTRANALELREQNVGEVALDSSALRLSLFGARGALVCYLWYDANEKQKKHEWNLVDQRVNMIMKLQPHFITPWLYQSWNLAYNVSVEFDRIRDKYTYIARGVELLSEGERLNRDNAEMRFSIANYQQGKMGISDENNTLRSLYQMSSMDPRERNPARFRNEKDEINWGEFEDFCQKHPHLVRRLREKLGCRKPADVIDFLAANYKLPTRYEYPEPGQTTAARLKPLAERFPILPPVSDFRGPTELNDEHGSELADDKDNYAVARAWYGYAQDPLDKYAAKKMRRRPKFGMAEVIFRSYPARAQCYVAERREQEGWFDEEGWEIAEWFPQSLSDPDGMKRPLAVGVGTRWAAEPWELTHQMYRAHGEKNGLYRTAEEVRNLPPEQLADYQRNRSMTNFEHFFVKSMVEQTSEAIAARKRFHKAEELYKQAEVQRSLKLYEDPLALGPPSTWSKDKATGWKRILLKHPEFRRDIDVQEESFGIQTDYFKAFYREHGRMLRSAYCVQDCLTLTPGLPALAAVRAAQHASRPLPPPGVRGPFDDVDDEGQPLVSEDAVQLVQSRKGIPSLALGMRGPATPVQPSPPPSAPPPAGGR